MSSSASANGPQAAAFPLALVQARAPSLFPMAAFFARHTFVDPGQPYVHPSGVQVQAFLPAMDRPLDLTPAGNQSWAADGDLDFTDYHAYNPQYPVATSMATDPCSVPFEFDFSQVDLPLPDAAEIQDLFMKGLLPPFPQGSMGLAGGTYDDSYPEVQVQRSWPLNQQEAIFSEMYEKYTVDTMEEGSWFNLVCVKHYLAEHNLVGTISRNPDWGYGIWTS